MFCSPGKNSWSTLVKSIFLCVTLIAPQAVHAEEQTKPVEKQVDKNGDAVRWAILAAALGSAVFYEEGHEGTIQLFKSFAVSEIITAGLKEITDKTRPNGHCCESFPSGHASKAFMGATFIHKRYGRKYGIPAYIAATYVGYTRVKADKHYVEDVVAGAAIGILSSYFFTTPYKDLEVTPLVGNGFYGVYLNKSW
jgi:hypothetical protein